MKKAWSSTDLLATKYDEINWDGEWFDNFDNPETRGVWSVSGRSGNGKTAFLLQLAKALTKAGLKVLYDSMEEGNSKTMQNAWKLHGMADCGRKLQLVQESIEEVDERLSKRQSADVVFFDSFQYTDLSWREFLAFKKKHHKKLLIFNMQMDGNKIMGKTADRVNFDADLKIWVEGFKAFSKGRYFGKFWQDGYTIWDEGAVNYWGK
ncbi:ATP-binding protein [Epilithonimonas arachidiradicis]|uniref:AAA domain-containing protein n=1 Tax=Epilithonimonas arachidiradicis TaxID=1617282 RepID=A0A420DE37_9FLAO|nr:ATP-binding protein [Epilithonimonas arachidiradicis]RKE90043.1 hypothetical protein BXY58_0628 [Epilithonimonas arachidiradicis]GGG47276.1 hypothetical protein GCM10007332_06000 [Epilithonimonas arachidiradicis]